MEIGFENPTSANSRVGTDYPSRARMFSRGMCCNVLQVIVNPCILFLLAIVLIVCNSSIYGF